VWTQCQRKWGDANSQEVGLEAAILERVRNSSLVESPRADNVSGLKSTTDAADGLSLETGRGRGAFPGCEARPRGLVEPGEVRMPV
jgi:hypothetical protein